MAVDAAYGKSEEQGAAGLPAEVESPAQPESLSSQVGCGKQESQRNRDQDAGAVRTRHLGLHDGVISRESQRRSEWSHCMDKALKSIAAKGNLLSQRCK